MMAAVAAMKRVWVMMGAQVEEMKRANRPCVLPSKLKQQALKKYSTLQPPTTL